MAARCLLLYCLSTFNLSGGVASELAARCLLLYCLSTFNLSGGDTSAFDGALIEFLVGSCCFGLSSVILLLCRRAAVAGLHCLLPSASDVLSEYLQFCLGKSLSSICLGFHASVCCQMSPNVLSEYLQSAWGSYICILFQ